MPETNVLDEARQLIGRRLDDLDAERQRLQRALAELDGGAAPRATGRPRGRRSAAGAPRKRRRRRGTRAEQAIALIAKKPGSDAGALAEEFGIEPTYLYRVLGDLTKEGRVRKDGRSYFPAEK